MDRSRLRFALPTIEKVKLYLPGATHIADRQFKDMKSPLLSLPFCQALVTNPSAFAKALRPSEEEYSYFVEKVKPLLHASLSLTEETSSLQSQRMETTGQSVAQPFLTSSPDLSGLDGGPKTGSRPAHPLTSLASWRYQEISEDEYYSGDSEAPSEAASPSHDSETGTPNTFPVLWAPESAPYEHGSAALASEFCFDPSTVQQEPDIPEPSPRIRDHLATCQPWGKEGWKRVQYKEAERKFKHSGGFQPLLVSLQLASRDRDAFGLRQMERVMANFQYGIFAQREAFSQAANAFLSACPEAASKFVQAFTSEQAEIRIASQDLVQYACR
ncbi:hypothetical protein WDU94_012142 [Cyamophila willieti]